MYMKFKLFIVASCEMDEACEKKSCRNLCLSATVVATTHQPLPVQPGSTLIQRLPNITKILPAKKPKWTNSYLSCTKPSSRGRTVQSLLDSAQNKVATRPAPNVTCPSMITCPSTMPIKSAITDNRKLDAVVPVTAALPLQVLIPRTTSPYSRIAASSSEPKSFTERLLTTNSTSPKLSPVVQAPSPSLDDITSPRPLSPRDMTASIEDYIINIVGENLNHLGPNIPTAELVAHVTNILRSLPGVTQDKCLPNHHYQSMEYTFQSSDESHLDPRMTEDAPWPGHSQSSASSQILDSFSSPIEVNTYRRDPSQGLKFSSSRDPSQGLAFSNSYDAVLEIDQGAVMPVEIDQGAVIPVEIDHGAVMPVEIVSVDDNPLQMKAADTSELSGIYMDGLHTYKPQTEPGTQTISRDTNNTANIVTPDMLELIMNTVRHETQSNISYDTAGANKRAPEDPIHAEGWKGPHVQYYCLDCDTNYEEKPCPSHHDHYTIVSDAAILSRARMSLPERLVLRCSRLPAASSNITDLLDGADMSCTGVFARETIPKRTKFGPLVGVIQQCSSSKVADGQLIWEIFDVNTKKRNHTVDCTDENLSNWMRFVQQARHKSELNVVAYQENHQIYMVTRNEVQPDTELLFWFGRDYAQMIGTSPNPCLTWKCNQCNRRLSGPQRLKQHKQFCPDSAVAGAPWRCAYCAKQYNSLSKLRAHLQVHLGDKPFTCDICSKSFQNQSNLRVHKRIHTGDRRFPCSECDTSFTQRAHLESHMLTHTKVKNFICQYCDTMFARASELRVHEHRHTRERVLTCHVCSREFFKMTNYKSHLKIHTNQRDFSCQNCGKLFFKKYHVGRHHKICKGPKEVKVKSVEKEPVLSSSPT